MSGLADLSDPGAIAMPPGFELVRTSPEFDEASVPAALRSAHRTSEGIWGRLVVLDGSLRFTFEAAPGAGREVRAGQVQVIPPGALHRVEPGERVRFVVEFHRLGGAE